METMMTERPVEAAKHIAADVRQKVKEESERAAEQARSEAQRLVAERRDSAAAYLHDVVDAAQGAAALLEERGRRGAASCTRAASAHIGRWSDGIEHQDVGELISRAEDFARRRPALFLGVAVILGYAAIRWLSAKSEGARASAVPEGEPVIT